MDSIMAWAVMHPVLFTIIVIVAVICFGEWTPIVIKHQHFHGDEKKQ